jgi:anaphase-promoting complex subunit 3
MEGSNLADTKKFLRVAVPNALPAVAGPTGSKRTSIKIPQKIKSFNVVPAKSSEELKADTPFALAVNTQLNQKLTEESPPLRHSFKTRQTTKTEPTIMTLLKQIAGAVQCLAAYKCPEAIKLFKQLPKSQYNTGWTLTQLGRALFESLRYTEAEKAYREALNVDPYRLEGVEYYSTCLWHLKKHVDLCTVSNQVLKISLFSAEAWCAVGNFFSLQKEHETALKYFKRAIQLNSHCAYAYTLSGHEYAANEDFDNARKCYQKAISCDERHYNAFWGMGNICLRQEKYDQAIQYFRHAIKINYKSSVLHTYLGMTYFHNKQANEALDCFERAEKLDPENPLNKYQKATVLISMNKFTEALNVLEELRIKVPKEAPIHVLIGKIHKKMGNKDKALAHFNMAMDLDPKESNVIKSLIDRLERDTDLPEENEI